MSDNPKRFIQVTLNRYLNAEEEEARLDAYLYDNYGNYSSDGKVIVIEGYDRAGWTAEAQIERLRSGLFAAVEID